MQILCWGLEHRFISESHTTRDKLAALGSDPPQGLGVVGLMWRRARRVVRLRPSHVSHGDTHPAMPLSLAVLNGGTSA